MLIVKNHIQEQKNIFMQENTNLKQVLFNIVVTALRVTLKKVKNGKKITEVRKKLQILNIYKVKKDILNLYGILLQDLKKVICLEILISLWNAGKTKSCYMVNVVHTILIYK